MSYGPEINWICLNCGQIHFTSFDIKDHCKRCAWKRPEEDPIEVKLEQDRIDEWVKKRQ